MKLDIYSRLGFIALSLELICGILWFIFWNEIFFLLVFVFCILAVCFFYIEPKFALDMNSELEDGE